MIALDTNILVRVVTADDPAQLEAALTVMRSDSLWVCKTVLLETEWVLRYSYKLSREAILASLRGILGYRALQVESRVAVLRALSLYEKGMDFADACHLTSSADAEHFATFDRDFATAAKAVGGADLPVVELLRPF
jgi:predicted nucleic-acid-binding protein